MIIDSDIVIEDEDLKPTRDRFAKMAGRRGISVDDAAIIASELFTNPFRYSALPGLAHIRYERGAKYLIFQIRNPASLCALDKDKREVAKSLTIGSSAPIDFRYPMPPPDATNHRGIEMVCNLCDENSIKVSQRLSRGAWGLITVGITLIHPDPGDIEIFSKNLSTRLR